MAGEVPTLGDVWTTRVFREPHNQLRVFKLVVFMNLSIGVIDMEDRENFGVPPSQQRIIWFARGELQFFDLVSRQQEKKLESPEEVEIPGSRRPNPPPRSGGRTGHDAGIRQERHGQDSIRRNVAETSPPARHSGEGHGVDKRREGS